MLPLFNITPSLTLLEPQSRFGDKPLKFQVVCPQNGTAVLEGLIRQAIRDGNFVSVAACQSVAHSKAAFYCCCSLGSLGGGAFNVGTQMQRVEVYDARVTSTALCCKLALYLAPGRALDGNVRAFWGIPTK